MLCDVCRVRDAVVLDNHPTDRWRVLCDRCERIHLDEISRGQGLAKPVPQGRERSERP